MARIVDGVPLADRDRPLVRDRRSVNGTKDAPAHLPMPPVAAAVIAPEERDLLAHFVDELVTATRLQAEHAAEDQARVDGCQQAVNGAMRKLCAKYGLAGTDNINARTGAIHRADAAGPR